MNKILYIKRKILSIIHSIPILHSVIGKIILTFYKYIGQPILTLYVKSRCSQSKTADPLALWKRFTKMRKYRNTKCSKECYQKNMEAIVHMSEDFNVPQYVIIAKYNPDTSIIKYKGKDGKTYGSFGIYANTY